MKEIKDYLHLYLGCECRIADNEEREWIRMVNETGLSVCTGTNTVGVPVWYKSKDCKPILRPLSDMKEEEAVWVADLAYTDAVAKQHRALIGMAFIQYTFLNKALSADMITSVEEIGTEHAFELTRYLLKQGFDLFGLIESGLAISKTQTQEQ